MVFCSFVLDNWLTLWTNAKKTKEIDINFRKAERARKDKASVGRFASFLASAKQKTLYPWLQTA